MAGAKAFDLSNMVKDLIREHCAEGDPRNFKGSLTLVCAINDIKRLKSEARKKASDLSRFNFEENYSHFKLDFIELANLLS